MSAGEKHHYIGISTEIGSESKRNKLIEILGLPLQKSDAGLIQNEISRTGWIELGQ